MASAREMRLRIRSVKNISQVTRALEAVSASKVRKAVAAVTATRPYATKAWQVLTHIAGQPGRESLHPLLTRRNEVKKQLVVLVSGDRGLAGAYNTNIVRFVLERFARSEVPVSFITVGRKGRDLMLRRRQNVVAEFSNLPAAPSFADVSAIGRMAVDEFLKGDVDEVYLVYRRSEAEMPARAEEIEHAKEEGVNFRLLVKPEEFSGIVMMTPTACTTSELNVASARFANSVKTSSWQPLRRYTPKTGYRRVVAGAAFRAPLRSGRTVSSSVESHWPRQHRM